MSNRALWDSVFVTDPAAVTPITGKDYGGNSPKPYWIVQRLTDVFGPCGIGWGYMIDNERFERFSETDVLHVAKVTLWYVWQDKRGEVSQMGQTKASYVTSKGAFKLDEDAPKKSITDALVKCASYLGFAGDIFSGRWDDSKYVAAAGKAWKDGEAPDAADVEADATKAKTAKIADDVRVSATEEAWKSLDEDTKRFVRALSQEVLGLMPDADAALNAIVFAQLEPEQKAGLWHLLDSTTRTALNKAAGGKA